MEGGKPRSLADRGYLAGLVGVLTLEVAGVAVQTVTGVPVPGVALVATAFAVACMLRIHGVRATMAFIALVFAIPYASEFVGVLTGVPYGAYAYTGLEPWLFGLVPFFIFIAWINITYLVISTTTWGLGRSSLWLAPLDGLLAAAWDVIVDPLAVRAGYWRWLSSGGLYGVPLSNFLGWFLVVSLLSLVVRSVWARDATMPTRTTRTMAAILPTLLAGSAAAFAALAVDAGQVLSAALGLAVIVPAVGIAWTRIRVLPFAPAPRTLWSRPTASLGAAAEPHAAERP